MRTAAEIRAYIEAATKGPWVKGDAACNIEAVWEGVTTQIAALGGDSFTGYALNKRYQIARRANRDFVLNARTDLPRLLDAAQKLRHEFEALADLENEREGRIWHETAWLQDVDA